ncbi:hypothetical protein [Streptomyces sp. NPDC058694]|uniref:hypothetical protein n=1 Tax=Streptomyces sp. NPDC058694 TaxID=3346603 RepID=UPI00364CE642
MLGHARESKAGIPRSWPWEQDAVRAEHRRPRIDGAWPLGAATLMVLAGGYAWLGSVVVGLPGALLGCAAGLLLSGLLHLLVESAVSGPRPSHHRVRGAVEARPRFRRRG